MDLRTELSSDSHETVFRRLDRIPIIKGAHLASVKLLYYMRQDTHNQP